MTLEIDGTVLNVILLDMDACIHEQVNKNTDGSYTVFLNARHSRETMSDSFAHAVGHILRRDWEKGNVQEIEYSAHKKDRPLRN